MALQMKRFVHQLIKYFHLLSVAYAGRNEVLPSAKNVTSDSHSSDLFSPQAKLYHRQTTAAVIFLRQ